MTHSHTCMDDRFRSVIRSRPDGCHHSAARVCATLGRKVRGGSGRNWHLPTAYSLQPTAHSPQRYCTDPSDGVCCSLATAF